MELAPAPDVIQSESREASWPWLDPIRRLTRPVPCEPDARAPGPDAHGYPAAVVALIVDGSPPAFLMTNRSAMLHEHGGEVAFPGGRIESWDADPATAALRELEEEVGIGRDRVRPLGYLPGIWTGNGRYWVTPLLAWLPGPFDLSALDLSPEVESVFPLPLAIGLDPRRYGRPSAPGIDIPVPMLLWDGPLIWGATARILLGCAQAFEPAAQDTLR